MPATRHRIYGVMAEFDDPSALVAAATRAREAGYRCMDAYSPFPIEELDEALGPQPTGLPLVLILEPKEHYDIETLPAELAAELGPLMQRVERAVRSAGDIGRVHIGRWGEGSEHLHWWFMGRPARMRQLSDSFAAIWDDVLPPVPEDVWRASVEQVVAALG